MAEINIVPYVDVMLVLLVIFMATAPLMMQGVEVDLPRAHSQALPQNDKPPLIISIDATGNFYLNINDNPRQSLRKDTLAAKIIAELKHDPSRQVLIKGDAKAQYGNIMNVMIMFKSAGIDKVGLMTDYNEAR